MSVVDWLKNTFDAVTGRHQEFEELMKKKDINRIRSLMTDNSVQVAKAIKEYDVNQHEVMFRPDKAVFGAKDPITGARQFLRWDKKWKIPIPYQVYINEIALVFLYGRPLKWSQLTTDTDKAFDAFKDFLEDKHFNSQIREAKRLAGAETQSAMLFHVFQNEEGKADCLIKVLAKSKGDEILFRKDQYGRLKAFAWGYYLTESGRTVYHWIFIRKTQFCIVNVP
ncbi:MAG: hypothetical protein LIP01_05970 [Tannerellaceae bacterium]|nr:hypothetical protein [Tannerellaceae bacterium]